MMIKSISKFAVAIIIFFSLTACGYKIAGYDSPSLFYIERVENKTIDTQYGEVVQEAVDSYFIIYGEMSSYERANYLLNIELDKVTLEDNIVSATNESVNSNIILDVRMIVTDKSGRELFSYRNQPSVSFNISQSISETLKNRNKAIREAMTDTLDIFRDKFNATFL